MNPRLSRELGAALRAGLAAAGKAMLAGFGKVGFSYKGRANLVTEVDHACEEAILAAVLRRFPDHGYVTEERAARRSRSGWTWVVDPLDGTTNYAHGFPAACSSVAVFRGGKPLMGGVYDPFRDELFLAEAGRGASLNGRPMRVSRTRRLDAALLITGFPYDRAERSRFYTEHYRRFMLLCHDVRRTGSAALDMAWTAAGRADGFWEFKLNPWDVAAGLLLVREAGGRVTDFKGRPWRGLAGLGSETLATNGLIHTAMLARLRT